MPGIWVYSENNAVARQLISAGLGLKDLMNEQLAVITTSAEDAALFFASGADRVVVLKGGSDWPESYSGAIGELLRGEAASVTLIGGTPRGKNVAATVAAILKVGLVSDAQTVLFAGDHIETTRLMYGGLALCTEAVTLPAMVTILPHTFAEPAASGGKQGEAVSRDAAVDDRVTIGNVTPIAREGVDIAAADKLVCVGRGLNKKEDLTLAQELAAALGAEVACTRGVAEDYRWLPVERYIGISGQKVKPDLYISLGVSGQVQHVAGLRDSKIIVAINNNEKAPIFEAADYGIVGDLYEVTPLLTEAIRSSKVTEQKGTKQ